MGCGLFVTRLWLGVRPELAAFAPTVSFAFKTGVLGAWAFLVLNGLAAAAVPLGRFTLKIFAGVFALLFALALAHEWITHSTNEIVRLFYLPNFKDCLRYVFLYGSCLSLILLLVARARSAPVDTKKMAGLIGLAAACIGAVGYSVHCIVDSPTFILVSYGIPMIVLYGATRLLFPRFLEW
jgi:hypothetical protein